ADPHQPRRRRLPRRARADERGQAMSRLVKALGPRDHVFGEADAPVTLVEYGDYECPYCGRAQAEVSEVLRNLGDVLRFSFRHFPLSQVHPHAVSSAQAAEAAAAQGKFWPMHATLFENQDALDFDDLVVYADSLGLDVPAFTDELRTGAHLPKISED